MPYEVLARKWRPQLFEDVIGQEHVAQTLVNAIKTGRLAHAYLFSGPRGIGKTSVARILAKAINCEQGEPGSPCNQCRSCIEITDGASVDVQEIDGASNRGIDEIRALRDNVKYMPSNNKYRVYIIDEVHMLTLPAFNALLKTLEEPPAHVKFIFATTETNKVPVTILSRCQRFDFKRIPLDKIVSHLENITSKERIEINRSGLALIARETEGCMRDAQSLLDQVISFTGPKAGDEDVTEILGIIDRQVLFDTSRAVIEGDSEKCLNIVDRIYNYGYDIKEFYITLMDQFRNLLISVIAPDTKLIDMSESELEEIKEQAEQAGEDKLQVVLNFLINREQDLRFSSYPRLILETTLIKLCHLGEYLSYGELLERIGALEKRLATAAQTGEQHTGHVSDPGGDYVSKGEKPAAKDRVPAPEEGKSWDDFLAFLSSKNKPMSNNIKNWHFVKLTEQFLEIAKGDQSFSASYFDDPETFNQLSVYCRDFFNRDIKIKVVANNKPAIETKKESNAQSPDPKIQTKHANLSPPVQDILHMFQGELLEGSSDKKPSGPDKAKGVET